MMTKHVHFKLWYSLVAQTVESTISVVLKEDDTVALVEEVHYNLKYPLEQEHRMAS